jgi:NADH-quinone oxidoreductase subunit L
VFAICGIGWGGIGLSGYYSRGLIVRNAGAFAVLATGLGRSHAYWLLFIAPVVGAGLTAWCMTRCWILAFWGEPRDRRLFDHAREVSMLYWPLVILAIMTALAGNWLGIHDMVDSSIVEARQAAAAQAAGPESARGASSPLFSAAWPGEERADEDASATIARPAEAPAAEIRGNQLAAHWLWLSISIGMVGAILLYLPGLRVAAAVARVPPVNWVRIWLAERMYFDEFYESLFVISAAGAARLIAWFDWMVLDGLARFTEAVMLRGVYAIWRRRGRTRDGKDSRGNKARLNRGPVLPPRVQRGRE